jgi:EAL domain-containing protein (putative c-di-GMP-specific phosphodiesterase class I)
LVELDTNSIYGVEALLRWQHPKLGLLPPSAFIEMAEHTGSIVEIGAWVLERATRQLRSWHERHGNTELYMSVNVSVNQLEERDFAQRVLDVLAHNDVPPSSLVLEVTESVLARPDSCVAVSLQTLRKAGVRVAIDDFGTGYSSMSYLRSLPVDILKIDRAFVSGNSVDGQGEALLAAIVEFGQRLGLDVIPEGIEEADQLALLVGLGCRIGQGFLLGRPAPRDVIDRRIAATTRSFC